MKLFILIVASLGLVACDSDSHHHFGHRCEPKAQRISCVNNLKQIGLGFRIWAGDHDDHYPFNLTTNAGGTLEHCAVDAEGFDRNASFHFQVVANELSTPKVLVCPDDKAKSPALDFGWLAATNVTYRLRSGTNTSAANSKTVLAACPVDGNVLYCDGTVVGKSGHQEILAAGRNLMQVSP